MRCNWCGKGNRKNYTKDKEGNTFYYYCSNCIGQIAIELTPKEKKQLIDKIIKDLKNYWKEYYWIILETKEEVISKEHYDELIEKYEKTKKDCYTCRFDGPYYHRDPQSPCYSCVKFSNWSKKEPTENKTIKVDLGIPESVICIKCRKKIDVIEYMARKNNYKNQMCFKCTKDKELSEKEPTEAGSARQTEENEGDFDCPICNKGVMIGYFLHKHCWEDLKADREWLLKHAGHDDELETLEEYTEKMIELNKHFGKKEDADDR